MEQNSANIIIYPELLQQQQALSGSEGHKSDDI